MTGFGRAQLEANGARVTATIQSWNHRHADLVFRLPDRLRGLESRLKARIAESVRRGRCEVTVRIDGPESAGGWRLDRPGLETLLDQAGELVASGRVEARLALGDLLRSPFVTAATPEEGSADEPAVERAVDLALEELMTTRAAEGARLGAALRAGAEELARLVDEMAARRGVVLAEFEAALRRRLDQLLPGGSQALPADRLAQEVVLLVERSDVEEELERLRGHLAAFEEASSADGAVGKRLDFLVQEIQRELSTLGAKARDLDLTRRLIDAKVINEQLREQIQNVE